MSTRRFTRLRSSAMSGTVLGPPERITTPVWLWSQSTPLASMTLSSTQRCSSKRLTTGAPFGCRCDQSRAGAAPLLSAAAAGDAALASALPAAATMVPDCRKARRSMMCSRFELTTAMMGKLTA
jgi:hypothetical protein